MSNCKPYEDNTSNYIRCNIVNRYKLGSLLYQLYLDLKLVKNWKVIEVRDNKEEDICYLIGKQFEDEKNFQIIVPMDVNTPTSISRIYEMFLNTKDCLENEQNPRSLVVGIIAPDSSISYYKLHSGLVPPHDE